MEHGIVVITGAGSGLGASLAKKYAEQGLHVCLLGRTKEKLEKISANINGNYSIHQADVTIKEQVTETIQGIERHIGPIDILINNAGVGMFNLAENIDEQDVHRMIDINLKGTIFCTQSVMHVMKKHNRGRIINIVSTAGKQGKVNESVYCASKFGVRGFTESLALELKDTPLQVIGVYMGGMRTEFWDGIFSEEQMVGLMDPDDVADIIINGVKPRTNLTVEELVIKNKKA